MYMYSLYFCNNQTSYNTASISYTLDTHLYHSWLLLHTATFTSHTTTAHQVFWDMSHKMKDLLTYREIVAPILFLPSLSAGEFQTEQIPCLKLHLFEHIKWIWVNVRWDKAI